jgi:glycosyltransferase involved in cell wall biosynthesis
VGNAAPPVADPKLVSAMRDRHGLSERYFLAVGDLEPRKAPDLLARAHTWAGTDTLLAFVGVGRMAPVLRGVPNVRLLGALPDRDLDLLYAGALALCYPTLLEGFGFPPLEAALRGTPSVVSDLAVLRETLDGAAVFIPPGDERALAGALAQIADDAILRKRLALAAYQRAAPRTWETAAHGARASLARAAGLK